MRRDATLCRWYLRPWAPCTRRRRSSWISPMWTSTSVYCSGSAQAVGCLRPTCSTGFLVHWREETRGSSSERVLCCNGLMWPDSTTEQLRTNTARGLGGPCPLSVVCSAGPTRLYDNKLSLSLSLSLSLELSPSSSLPLSLSLPLSPSLLPVSLSVSGYRAHALHAAPDPGLAVSSPSLDWSCLRLLLLAPPVAAVRLLASTCGRRGGRRTQAEASRVAPIAPRGGEVSARWRGGEQPRCGWWRRSEWSSGPHGAGRPWPRGAASPPLEQAASRGEERELLGTGSGRGRAVRGLQ